jgi:hypothetical protein
MDLFPPRTKSDGIGGEFDSNELKWGPNGNNINYSCLEKIMGTI